jgi:fructokinase
VSLRIGIDLGGTKTEAIALEGSAERHRVRIGTPRAYDPALEAIAALVVELERVVGAGGTVGVGIPGAVSPTTGLVKNANSTWLNGRPLVEDLRRKLGRDVRVANDANCLAVSEAADGAAAGAEVVFGVIVGTGTGGGIVVRGRVVTGPNAIAGEWGHNPLPWADDDERPGPACYCGKRGCIETFLSGPGLAADFARRTGRTVQAPEIAALAVGGDADAEAALRRYEGRMARSLAGVINVLDPDVIVVGGGLSNMERLYANVPRLWGDFVFGRSATGSPEPVRTRLVRAMHGDSSGVRGAAWLWQEGDGARRGDPTG